MRIPEQDGPERDATTTATRRPPEPEGRGRRLVGWWIWVLVAVAAALGAVLAPAPWPTGQGMVTVARAGFPAVEVPVAVGDPGPVEVTSRSLTLSLPGGVPLDGPLEVAIAGDGIGADTTVALRLPDGRVQSVALVVEGEGGRATRRPLRATAPVLALLAAVVVLWVSEAVPLWVTSLLVPVVLVAARVEEAQPAFAPFFHPIIVLFLAGFLLAAAMRRVGLDQGIARAMLTLSRGRPVRLYLGFLGLAAAMSMFMSNTAAVAVLLPIALTVTRDMPEGSYRRALVLGTAYAATIGGVGSAIGTPANLLAITFLDDLASRQITFLSWFGFGLPVIAVLLPFTAWYVWRRYRPVVDPHVLSAAVARSRRDPTVRAGAPLVLVLAVLIAVFAGWLTEPLHGLHVGVTALLGALVLAAVGIIRGSDLPEVPWAALLTFGGGLALGVAVSETGLSDAIAASLGEAAGLPAPLAILAVAAVALALTTVASNTAAAALFVPLAVPLATVLGVDVVILVVAVAIASSTDFALVIGTPPTMMAHATGLYSARELLRVGIVLDLVALLTVSLVIPPLWAALGLAG